MKEMQIWKNGECVASDKGFDITANGFSAEAHRYAPCHIVFIEDGAEYNRFFFDGNIELKQDKQNI